MSIFDAFRKRRLLNKWKATLDYSSATCPPIPINERYQVALLYENAEKYCRKHGITMNVFEESNKVWLRRDYKRMTFCWD